MRERRRVQMAVGQTRIRGEGEDDWHESVGVGECTEAERKRRKKRKRKKSAGRRSEAIGGGDPQCGGNGTKPAYAGM
jgi:hypothetical protein